MSTKLIKEFFLKKKKNAFKIILSVFIIYHLFAVVISPHFVNDFEWKPPFFLSSYLNFFGLLTQWSFFAPNPGPPPIYLEWELVDRHGGILEAARWPEFPDPFFLRERQNRRIVAVRNMVEFDLRASKMMLPYLCKKKEDVNRVRLWSLIYSIPSRLEIVRGTAVIGDRSQYQRHWVSDSFCKEPQS